MHRDFHPRNILVDKLHGGFKILQITDFGLSKNKNCVENFSESLKDLTAAFYKAPEVFKGEDPTTKVDMWALGVILFELQTKKRPFNNISDITDANQLEIPFDIPPLIRTIIAILLDKEPANRPSAKELLNQPELVEPINDLRT